MESGPETEEGGVPSPRKLPDDLPRSLDDRRRVPAYEQETEIYDAWQGGHLWPFRLIRPQC